MKGVFIKNMWNLERIRVIQILSFNKGPTFECTYTVYEYIFLAKIKTVVKLSETRVIQGQDKFYSHFWDY